MTTATATTRPAHRGARGLIALFAVPWLLAPSVTGEGMQDPTLAAAPPVPVAPTAAAAPRPPTTEGAVVTYAALSDP
ncbi:MAG: hypothetical protein GVY27_08295, partial [Deinococcus-Thermus bacterium]|nr:hypothetical protein [Deinococcota bacterium]